MKNLLITLSIFLLAAGCSKTSVSNFDKSDNTNVNSSGVNTNGAGNANTSGDAVTNENAAPKDVIAPIARAAERVTKKPFGIYITPKTSPVQPEKFTGYHSGVDFETFPEEKDTDVPFNAVCDGKIAAVRTASGYGGVITEYCSIITNKTGQANGADQKVTVIYGHIRYAAAKVKAGQEVKAGDQLGVLGTGYSSETDGERKHLHLGIEKGWGTDIRGYVQEQSQLSNFLDITKLW